MLNARDNTERREVFTRDVPTVATVLFAKKGISGLIAKAAEKKSGAIITNGPVNYKELSAFKKFCNLFKPNGGVTVFGSEDFTQKYTNIQNQETFTKMLEYVKKSGGDIKKLLSIDEGTKSPAMFDFAKDVLKGDFKKMSDDDILKVLKSKDNADKVNEFVKNVMDNKDVNPIIQTCRKTSGIIQTVSFLIAVGILGIALPKLNVFLSKRAKEKEDAKAAESQQKPENVAQVTKKEATDVQAVPAVSVAEQVPQEASAQNVQANSVSVSDLVDAKQTEEELKAFKQVAQV